MKIERDEEKPGTWKLDGTIRGKRIRERGFRKQKDAEDFFAELRVQAKRGKFGLERDRPRVLVSELVEARVEDLQGGGAEVAGKRLRSFASLLPKDLSVDEIKQSHFREWTKDLRRRGLKPNSINRYLADVSVMFRMAPSMFAILEADDWRAPKIPWEKASKRGRERVISTDERATLLEALRFPQGRVDGKGLKPSDIAARRDVADCFELAYLTGMRGIEVRRLEWSEVDLGEAEAHLPGHKTKTREPRDVLLNRRALEILRRRYEARGSRFVFPNEAGDGPRKEISRVVRPVARALGLRYGRNVPDGFSPHDTRHTIATEMLRQGRDLKTVQDVLGHSQETMSLRYAHSTRASRREAVESIGVSKPARQKVDKQN